MKKIRNLHKSLAVLLSAFCIFSFGCKGASVDETDYSTAYGGIHMTSGYDKEQAYDRITIGSSTINVWGSRTALASELGQVLGRLSGGKQVGGTEECTYNYLGCDCSITGILRERYQAVGKATCFLDISIGSSLSDLLTKVPDVTLLSSGVSDQSRYGLLVPNNIAVQPENYQSYLNAIDSHMLFPNCALSYDTLSKELSGVSNDRQKLYTTARLALMSDVINQTISHLLELTFIVDNNEKIVAIEYTLYSPCTSFFEKTNSGSD